MPSSSSDSDSRSSGSIITGRMARKTGDSPRRTAPSGRGVGSDEAGRRSMILVEIPLAGGGKLQLDVPFQAMTAERFIYLAELVRQITVKIDKHIQKPLHPPEEER